MMQANTSAEDGNGWPDANRKGTPLFPDQKLRHAIQIGDNVAVRWWQPKNRIWTNAPDWRRGWEPREIAVFGYIGPVMTQTDIAANTIHPPLPAPMSVSELKKSFTDAGRPFGMDEDMERTLGMPHFIAAPYAHAFQASGMDIPPRPEAEQAAIIFWMLTEVMRGKTYKEALADLTDKAGAMRNAAELARIDRRKEAIEKLKQKHREGDK